MTPEAIARVQASHHAHREQGAFLPNLFYERFFARAPRVRPYFPTDLTALKGHFDAALALIVRNLGEHETLAPAIRDLGADHIKWGAQPQYYAVAREALLDALRESSGVLWSETLERDWRTAIGAIIALMLQGAAVETAIAAEAFAEDEGAAPTEDTPSPG
jgi:hemoglobin-like flavoprotein